VETLIEHVRREAQHLHANLRQRLASMKRRSADAETSKPPTEAEMKATSLAIDRLAAFEPVTIGDGVACYWCAQFGKQGLIRPIPGGAKDVERYGCDTCGNAWPFPAGRR